MSGGGDIPFDAINRAALSGYTERLRAWFPAGKLQGREFVVGDLSGAAGRSLSINIKSGKWKDFSGGAGGKDPISLYAATFCSDRQGDAAKALAHELGIPVNGPAPAHRIPVAAIAPEERGEQWFPAKPPADVKDPPLGRYDAAWAYRDAAGNRISYVVRLDPNERRPKKLIFGITWGRRIWVDEKGQPRDETGWHQKHPAAPMPLYGLDRLAARPSAPVIVVEGEKACDAATAMFPEHVCVTWPRGGENVPYADWSALAGRSVILWPDNDPVNRRGVRPGHEAMHKVAEQLRGIAPDVVALLVDDLAQGEAPDGEDAADVTVDDPAAWLQAHMPPAAACSDNPMPGPPPDGAPPFDDMPVPRPLKVSLFSEIEPAINVNDFVEELLIEGAMSVVFGAPNCGKTFLVLDLAFHIARGAPWFGREVEQGGVLYVALEGGIGIRNRIAAYRQANGLDDAEIQFALITQPISLLDPEGVRSLIGAINDLSKRFESKLKLVVVDTASRALAGGDENSSVDMGRLIANADIIRAAVGTHICFIHHSGKDAARGARGWNGLLGAIDTELEVQEDQGVRTVSTRKQRDLDKGQPFGFTLDTIELGTNRRGKPVRSCIIRPATVEEVTRAVDPVRSLKGHARRAYDVLCNLIITDGRSGFHGTPDHILSLPEQSWREGFYSSAMPGADPSTRKKTFRRNAGILIEARLVAMADGRVWITRREQPGTS